MVWASFFSYVNGNPAISFKTRDFPSLPHDKFGFFIHDRVS